MKHIALLLYFISYTSGIGAITLASFFYVKSRNAALKYVIMADLFFTMLLFFDTLNFYTDLFLQGFPEWLQIFKIGGLLLAGTGLAYYFALSIYTASGVDISATKRLLYFVTVTAVLAVCTGSLYLLYHGGVISQKVAIHSGFFLSNLLTSAGSVYGVTLMIKGRRNMNKAVRQFTLVVVIITAVITPVSILSNLVQYLDVFHFPLAYSPFCYFLINLTGIVFAIRELQPGDSTHKEAEGAEGTEENTLGALAEKYGLTDRESQIVRLVASGLSNQEIGQRLFISSNTARNHIYNIYKKAGIKNRYELMNLASSNARTN